MTNIQAAHKFADELHGAFIDKMFWIAASYESRDLQDFLDELSEADIKQCFGFADAAKIAKSYLGEDRIGVITDRNKYGFIAEVHHPNCYNFSFNKKDNTVSSYSSSRGVCRMSYVYGETREELLTMIAKAANKQFGLYVAAARRAEVKKAAAKKPVKKRS